MPLTTVGLNNGIIGVNNYDIYINDCVNPNEFVTGVTVSDLPYSFEITDFLPLYDCCYQITLSGDNGCSCETICNSCGWILRRASNCCTDQSEVILVPNSIPLNSVILATNGQCYLLGVQTTGNETIYYSSTFDGDCTACELVVPCGPTPTPTPTPQYNRYTVKVCCDYGITSWTSVLIPNNTNILLNKIYIINGYAYTFTNGPLPNNQIGTPIIQTIFGPYNSCQLAFAAPVIQNSCGGPTPTPTPTITPSPEPCECKENVMISYMCEEMNDVFLCPPSIEFEYTDCNGNYYIQDVLLNQNFIITGCTYVDSISCITNLLPSQVATISSDGGICCGDPTFEQFQIWAVKDCKFQNLYYLQGPIYLQVGMVILATNNNCYTISGLASNIPTVFFGSIYDGACNDCINDQGGTPD